MSTSADARDAAIIAYIDTLKQKNARITNESSKDFETQEAYDARKRRNAEGLVDANVASNYIHEGIHRPGPNPQFVTKRGYLWNTKVSLERNLADSDNEAIDKLLAKAATVNLNQSDVDQVNTIKRIYTMLQIRAKDHKEYEAKLKDYSKLLQGYFKETADKKGWFGTTKGRNTFKYLRNAQANTTRTKNVTRSIEVQQIHAYNEILGLILALTAKAHNKFQSKTTFEWLRQRSKERLTARAVSRKDSLKDEKAWYDLLNSYVTKYDSDAGIYSLSTISSEYVYDVVARGKVRKLLNLREELSTSLKNAKDKVTWLSRILWRGVLPLGLAVFIVLRLTQRTILKRCPVRGEEVLDYFSQTQVTCPVEWKYDILDDYCSCSTTQTKGLTRVPKTRKIVVSDSPAVLSPDILQQIKDTFHVDAVTQQLYDIVLAIQTHFLDAIPGLVPAVSEAVVISQTFAIPTAAMLTYRTIRGAQKTGTFKAEFIELHKILFNSNNKIKFEDAIQKDFFVFNQLSQNEKSAILEFKKAFASGTPSDDSIKTYLGTMLQGGQKRQVMELLTDIPPEQAPVFEKKVRELYPSYVGWDLSYNPITSSFTYDCASDPNKTAWPEPGPFGILNPDHCKTCGGAHCTGPARPVKVGGSRRNRQRKLRKTRRNHTYY